MECVYFSIFRIAPGKSERGRALRVKSNNYSHIASHVQVMPVRVTLAQPTVPRVVRLSLYKPFVMRAAAVPGHLLKETGSLFMIMKMEDLDEHANSLFLWK